MAVAAISAVLMYGVFIPLLVLVMPFVGLVILVADIHDRIKFNNMKNLIFLFAFLFAGMANAQSFFVSAEKVDTFTNAETITIDNGYVFKLPYYYSVQIQADSLSGSTNATCLLQVTNSTSESPVWHNVQTLTIDGVQTKGLWEGLLYARRVRCSCTSTGTQSTRLQVYEAYKRAIRP